MHVTDLGFFLNNRCDGHEVRSISVDPWSATTLKEFWGKRWNLPIQVGFFVGFSKNRKCKLITLCVRVSRSFSQKLVNILFWNGSVGTRLTHSHFRVEKGVYIPIIKQKWLPGRKVIGKLMVFVVSGLGHTYSVSCGGEPYMHLAAMFSFFMVQVRLNCEEISPNRWLLTCATPHHDLDPLGDDRRHVSHGRFCLVRFENENLLALFSCVCVCLAARLILGKPSFRLFCSEVLFSPLFIEPILEFVHLWNWCTYLFSYKMLNPYYKM